MKTNPPPHHVKALECYNYILLIRWFSIIMVLAQTINILSLLLLSIYMMVGSSLIHLSVYLHPFFPLVLLSLLFLGCGAQFTQTFSCAANLSNQYMAAIFIGMVGFFFSAKRPFLLTSLSFNCLIPCVSLQAAIFKILFKVKKLLGFSSSACRIFHFFQAQFFNFYRPFKPTLFLMSCHTTNLGTLCFHV